MVGNRGAIEGYEGLQSCLRRMQVVEGVDYWGSISPHFFFAVINAELVRLRQQLSSFPRAHSLPSCVPEQQKTLPLDLIIRVAVILKFDPRAVLRTSSERTESHPAAASRSQPHAPASSPGQWSTRF